MSIISKAISTLGVLPFAAIVAVILLIALTAIILGLMLRPKADGKGFRVVGPKQWADLQRGLQAKLDAVLQTLEGAVIALGKGQTVLVDDSGRPLIEKGTALCHAGDDATPYAGEAFRVLDKTSQPNLDQRAIIANTIATLIQSQGRIFGGNLAIRRLIGRVTAAVANREDSDSAVDSFSIGRLVALPPIEAIALKPVAEVNLAAPKVEDKQVEGFVQAIESAFDQEVAPAA
jgi:hypothetical protein